MFLLIPNASAHPLKCERPSTGYTQILDHQIVIDPIPRTFASEPGLLNTSKRRDLIRNEPGINPDHAIFQRVGNTPNPPYISAIKIRGQSELGIVSHTNHFFIGRKPEQRREWPKRLLPGDLHF